MSILIAYVIVAAVITFACLDREPAQYVGDDFADGDWPFVPTEISTDHSLPIIERGVNNNGSSSGL